MADRDDMTKVERLIEEVERLTLREAECVARAFDRAKADPAFERSRFYIEVGVRTDCGANVEEDMFLTAQRINATFPASRDDEPWSTAWEAAITAGCALVGGWYADQEHAERLLGPWRAKAAVSDPGP